MLPVVSKWSSGNAVDVLSNCFKYCACYIFFVYGRAPDFFFQTQYSIASNAVNKL